MRADGFAFFLSFYNLGYKLLYLIIVFNYTYDKFPYQTFEPGFAQGSIQRDPRSIIGRSVRQIATEILGKRFIVL